MFLYRPIFIFNVTCFCKLTNVMKSRSCSSGISQRIFSIDDLSLHSPVVVALSLCFRVCVDLHPELRACAV